MLGGLVDPLGNLPQYVSLPVVGWLLHLQHTSLLLPTLPRGAVHLGKASFSPQRLDVKGFPLQ